MNKRIEVTADNLGDLLIKGLEEAVAVEEGRLKPARVSRHKLTAREAEIAPPPEYTPARIQRVRSEIGASQAVFASMLNVSKGTVSAWEQGEREPDGSNRRLLQVAEQHPEVLLGTASKVEPSPGLRRGVAKKRSIAGGAPQNMAKAAK